MQRIIHKESCTGCEACVNACPIGCIQMKEDSHGFYFPEIDESACIQCGRCRKVCPGYPDNREGEDFLGAYLAINHSQEKVMASSSGGTFAALAEAVLNQGGIVYGAGWDENLSVTHLRIADASKLSQIQKSKYVQSVIGESFKKAKKDLEDGRIVLFSGTPCQISGLRLYLGKNYDKLFCVDFVCHGVPSPGVWSRYREVLEKENKLLGVDFRDKTNSWASYDVSFQYEDEKTIREQVSSNVYMRGFLKDITLRDSCFRCMDKGIKKASDLTLADYWGVYWERPELKDAKGVSLVMVHTKQGEVFLQSVANELQLEEAEIKNAIRFNPAIVNASKPNKCRGRFWREYENGMDIENLLFKYSKDTIWQKTKFMGIQVLKSIASMCLGRNK